MKTNILIAGAVIIVVLGGVLIMSKPKEAGAPVTDVPGPVEVGEETTAQEGTIPSTQNESIGSPVATTPVNTTPPRTTGTNVSVPTTPAPAPFVATVYYDGNDFIPEITTIVQGGTVVFENTGERMMWVGSNNHPDHTRYPVKSTSDCLGSSFDQCKASGKGTSWSYTFTELGDWSYHNHVRSVDQGKIIVLTKEDYMELREEESN
jgi:hypothetical protein